jgi:phage shock protein C
MADRSNNTAFAVLAGLLLVFFGVWLLAEGIFAPLLWPLRWLITILARIGWPLLLIGVGALFILRARGGGWKTSGKPWRRSRSNRLIGGVLGGLSEVLQIDSTLLRIAYGLITLMTGVWFGILLYLAAMIFIPEDSVVASWNSYSDGSWTSPPPAPPVPQMPSNGAPTPPPAPAPPSSSAEPPQAPPVPGPPTVL